MVTLQHAGGEYTQACRRGASLGRVQPAFGPSREIIGETNIGPITASIVPGLHSSLVSANDLIEEGWEAHITKEGGTVTKPDFSTIPLYRKDGTWQIDISSIRNLDTPVFCELNARKVQLQRPKSSIKPTLQQGLEGEERRKIFDIVEHIHIVMGHPSLVPMCNAVTEGGCWESAGVTINDIKKWFSESPCLICQMAKRNLPGADIRLSERSNSPGEIIYCDILPRISPPALQGWTLAFIFSDEATGYLHAFGGTSKTEFLQHLQDVISFYKQWHCSVKILRSDSENVVNSQDINDYLSGEHIMKQSSVPYCHYQNAAERQIQTIEKGVSALLHDQEFCGREIWGFALLHFIDLRNHTPNVHTGLKSPEMIITGRRPDLRNTFLFKFGQLVACGVVPDQKLWKFDLKSDLGIYVFNPRDMVRGCGVYFPYSGHVSIRSGVAVVHASKDQLRRFWGIRDELKYKKLRWGELANFYELIQKDVNFTENLTEDTKQDVVYTRKTIS